MKTTRRFLLVAILIALAFTFFACSSDSDNNSGGGSDNPFVGTWEMDGSSGMVIVTIAADGTWIAKYNNSTYNSGTYERDGNDIKMKIADKGVGSAAVGDTGKAAIISASLDKISVTGFSDTNMNGSYSKK